MEKVDSIATCTNMHACVVELLMHNLKFLSGA